MQIVFKFLIVVKIHVAVLNISNSVLSLIFRGNIFGFRGDLQEEQLNMPSRFQGRLSPLSREALAEFISTFILVVCIEF